MSCDYLHKYFSSGHNKQKSPIGRIMITTLDLRSNDCESDNQWLGHNNVDITWMGDWLQWLRCNTNGW